MVARPDVCLAEIVQETERRHATVGACEVIAQLGPTTINSGFLFLHVSTSTHDILTDWAAVTEAHSIAHRDWQGDQGMLQLIILDHLNRRLQSITLARITDLSPRHRRRLIAHSAKMKRKQPRGTHVKASRPQRSSNKHRMESQHTSVQLRYQQRRDRQSSPSTGRIANDSHADSSLSLSSILPSVLSGHWRSNVRASAYTTLSSEAILSNTSTPKPFSGNGSSSIPMELLSARVYAHLPHGNCYQRKSVTARGYCFGQTMRDLGYFQYDDASPTSAKTIGNGDNRDISDGVSKMKEDKGTSQRRKMKRWFDMFRSDNKQSRLTIESSTQTATTFRKEIDHSDNIFMQTSQELLRPFCLVSTAAFFSRTDSSDRAGDKDEHAMLSASQISTEFPRYSFAAISGRDVLFFNLHDWPVRDPVFSTSSSSATRRADNDTTTHIAGDKSSPISPEPAAAVASLPRSFLYTVHLQHPFVSSPIYPNGSASKEHLGTQGDTATADCWTIYPVFYHGQDPQIIAQIPLWQDLSSKTTATAITSHHAQVEQLPTEARRVRTRTSEERHLQCAQSWRRYLSDMVDAFPVVPPLKVG